MIERRLSILILIKQPIWLPIAAGIRFSDLFTDISYILAAPSLTTRGWILLLPPPLLNRIGVIILLRGYNQIRNFTQK